MNVVMKEFFTHRAFAPVSSLALGCIAHRQGDSNYGSAKSQLSLRCGVFRIKLARPSFARPKNGEERAKGRFFYFVIPLNSSLLKLCSYNIS
jgi:hypothetical protein